ncbi:hypothetical protein ACHAW5_004535 [Stephanodiscus triporus]|uniref:Uncharacterized protein n=1 Tax=Stephanodiscus triporus TaxID=2934178 RepID=A0ABD3PTH1_9STRA
MQSPERIVPSLQTSQFTPAAAAAVAAPPRPTAAADARRLVVVDDASLGAEESADDYDDDVGGDEAAEEVYEGYVIGSSAATTIMEDAARPSSSSSSSSSSNQHQRGGDGGDGGDGLCTPVGECELCHHSWRAMLEGEDEKIKGEYESCVPYGRRMKFECTSVFQERDTSEKKFSSISEYRSCRYTDGDEQFRMLRMQILCLLFGIWSFRNVRRLKVVSASLFDLRRMRIQGSANNGNNSNSPKSNVKFSPLVSKNSSEPGKVPKSPAPDNMSMV